MDKWYIHKSVDVEGFHSGTLLALINNRNYIDTKIEIFNNFGNTRLQVPTYISNEIFDSNYRLMASEERERFLWFYNKHMNEENKLIEELASNICKVYNQQHGCDNCIIVNENKRRKCNPYKYATRAIQAGYRKGK